MADQVIGDEALVARGLVDATLSLKRGAELKFKQDDIEVGVWLSTWTGKEKIWIHDALVSELRTIGFNPWHRFEHDGHIYEAVMTVETGGAYMATILRDGEILFRGKTRALADAKPRSPVMLGLSALVSAVIGAALAYFAVSIIISWFGG